MSDASAISKADLLTNIQKGWNEFSAYLKTLNDTQLTSLKDAAGWTVKDHVIHIAVWENNVNALLSRQPRWEAMGIDQAIWQTNDFEKMNAAVYQRTHQMALAGALRLLQTSHQNLLAIVEALSEADLKRPYRDFQPDSPRESPVILWISGNTYEHFTEHTPWIEAIVAGH